MNSYLKNLIQIDMVMNTIIWTENQTEDYKQKVVENYSELGWGWYTYLCGVEEGK